MPGITRAAFTSELPLTPGGSTAAFTLRSRSVESGVISAQASPRVVSGRYFSTLGMRIVEGRGFADSDTQGSLPVVVVNRAFARRYLGDFPLGAQLPMGVGYETDGREATVVGVVDDIEYVTSMEPPLASAIRLAIREADARLVADALMRMDDLVTRGLARPRLYAVLFGGFAVLALVIAAVGLFGVLSYVVAQRSREFALRAALGAQPLDILRLVLQQGIAATSIGIVAGLVVAVALTRSIAALLYGVTPYDGLTFATVPVALLLVAVAACAAPALHAARLHPMRALRS